MMKFLTEQYPDLNNPEFTIITDRDKGLANAMEDDNFKQANFFCTFHERANNIKKSVGEKYRTFGN